MFIGWLTTEHNMPTIYKMLTFVDDTSENIFFLWNGGKEQISRLISPFFIVIFLWNIYS